MTTQDKETEAVQLDEFKKSLVIYLEHRTSMESLPVITSAMRFRGWVVPAQQVLAYLEALIFDGKVTRRHSKGDYYYAMRADS